ncbi:MAG: hypothetical protein JO316_19040 [Abitibacteriaceae bacterium]|nr:hypothetical protein [Abditibacteriaceae bacterium]MBV9867453.1 hypothetical protein [Abditibacteriaceae bacterium]
MKLFGRFALVAILGSLMASALLAGCGGSSDDTSNTAASGGSTSGAAGNGAAGNGASGNAASAGNKTS